MPVQAQAVLRRTVRALNEYEPKDPTRLKPGEMRFLPIGERMEVHLSPAALDLDPELMDASINELQSAATRDAFRLSLLEEAVGRYSTEAEEEQKKSAASPARVIKANSAPPARPTH